MEEERLTESEKNRVPNDRWCLGDIDVSLFVE